MKNDKYQEIGIAERKDQEELQNEIDGYESILKEIIEVSKKGFSLKTLIKKMEVDGLTVGTYEKYQKLIKNYKTEISELQDLYYAISDMVMTKCEQNTSLLAFLDSFEGEEYKLQFNSSKSDEN